MFPIDKRLIADHYDRRLAHKAHVIQHGRIKKIEPEKESKKIKNKNDYRYQKDLSTMRKIEKEWQL